MASEVSDYLVSYAKRISLKLQRGVSRFGVSETEQAHTLRLVTRDGTIVSQCLARLDD